MSIRPHSSLIRRFLAVAAAAVLVHGSAAAAEEKIRSFNIPAQPLAKALADFSRQSDVIIVAPSDLTTGKVSKPVKGSMSLSKALEQLLNGTALQYALERDGSVIVRARPAGASVEADTQLTLVRNGGPQAPQTSLASTAREAQAADSDAAAESAKGVPEILVKGSRSLNMDIERTEDAPQPYVVFSGEELRRSQAVNLEDFLRTRLPMNAVASANGQGISDGRTHSTINLRGLGANQTLILVDGRRMPGTAAGGEPGQSDINGIPLAAIERIEVLPSTAGGIYGGSATGGVINIILRRDFQGVEAKGTYANTFDTDVGSLRVDISGGFSLEGGRTQITLAASRSRANVMLASDRDFAERAFRLTLDNNPAAINVTSGSPPLSTSVNIRAVSGNLTLDDGRPLISSITGLPTNITHQPVGYAGPASDDSQALLANAGRYNLAMPDLPRGLLAAPSMESASFNIRREFSERLNVFIDLNRFGNYGQSVNYSSLSTVLGLPADAPNNPFQQPINVRFPTTHLSYENRNESTATRATAGLIARLPFNWKGAVDYGWSRSRFGFANTTGLGIDSIGSCVMNRGVAANVDPDGAGPLEPCNRLLPNNTADARPALDVLQDGGAFPVDYSPYYLRSPNVFGDYATELKDATLRLSGPALRLPGGPLVLSALVERRKEEIEDAFFEQTNVTSGLPTYSFYPLRSQDVRSYYLEARAPLVDRANALPLLRRLELQASVRRDAYETRGIRSGGVSVPSPEGPFPPLDYKTNGLTSTDYTLGLSYAPLQDLTLRASFGTGFLPPTVTQIAPNPATLMPVGGTDPRRGNTFIASTGLVSVVMGGNSDLRPEESESWSAGFIFTPSFLPGLRVSADYTRIEKVDEIQAPTPQFLLENDELFADRIQRGANRPGDQPGWAGVLTFLDQSLINIASTSLEAVDIQADYLVSSERAGDFRWYAIATRQLNYRNRLLPGAPAVDRVGYTGGPLEWRGNLGLDWQRGPLTVNWNMQYYDSYFIYGALAKPLTVAQENSRATARLNQGSSTIPRQMYHDLSISYRFDSTSRFAGGLLANSELSAGIQNLFDRSPPLIAATDTQVGTGYSTYGDPRLRRYTLTVRKGFGR